MLILLTTTLSCTSGKIEMPTRIMHSTGSRQCLLHYWICGPVIVAPGLLRGLGYWGELLQLAPLGAVTLLQMPAG